MTDIFHENMSVATFKELCDYMEFRWPQHTFLLLTKRPHNAAKFTDAKRLPKNVWLGVTVCNQKEADEKIPILLRVPAAKRFVSVEPMLESIDLDVVLSVLRYHHLPWLTWVICGAETGPGARPMDLQWARSLRDQCKEAGVPFFFKKAGNKKPIPLDLMIREFPER